MVQSLNVPINGIKKEFSKLNNSDQELFIFKILLIAIDWIFWELHHYLSIIHYIGFHRQMLH